MGTTLSCCVTNDRRSDRKYRRGFTSGDNYMSNRYNDGDRFGRSQSGEERSGHLQHISEREPDDIEEDPSSHPTKGPIFMERSKSDMRIKDSTRNSMYGALDNSLQGHDGIVASPYHLPAKVQAGRTSANGTVPAGRGLGTSITIGSEIGLDESAAAAGGGDSVVLLRKSASCGTVFLDDSTISQPNLKNTIKCISLAIYYHIVNRKNRGNERVMEIFDEKRHPLTRDGVLPDYDKHDPEMRYINRYIRALFNNAQLTSECAIITLVYIERLLTYAEIDLCPANWRRIVLGAILLASKVWDDQAVWNVDYCQILKDMNVEDMNDLERQFLECLQFNINVGSAIYAKYYFDLRTLALSNNLHLPLMPLQRDRAKKLEATSRICEDKLLEMVLKRKKRAASVNYGRPLSSRNCVVIP